MPPKPCICVRGQFVAGMVAAARVIDAIDPADCSASHSASRPALAQWRSIRTARVLSPRRVSQASNGPGTAPAAF